MEILNILKERNEVLFWFGTINLLTAVLFLFFSYSRPLEFAGVNAWYKPIKFALSTAILSWSVGWYTGYLAKGLDITICNWVIVITLAFEVIYIAWKASQGQASHFNMTSPFHSAMFSLMALAASIATLTIGYIGLKFFAATTVELPTYYLWAIRVGFLLFVFFAFQGFSMGARLAHTVGGVDGSQGLPFLNWSRIFGDLRVAHFIGMHALQILPLLAWYVLKDIRLTFLVVSLYAFLAIFVLIQALQAKPFLRFLNF